MATDPGEQAVAPAKAERPALWRRIVVPLCVAIGCVLVALSIVATWVKLTALDTDTYVDTVAPLVQDDDVALALATRVVDGVFERLDVEATVDDVLPSALQGFGAALVPVVQGYAVDLVDRAIQSPQFETIWVEANRRVHTQVVRLLTKPLVSDDTADRVQSAVLDLRSVVDQLNERLQARGIDLFQGRELPEGTGEIIVATRSQLKTARQAVDLLDTLAWVLPIVALAFFVVALVLSPRRARTVMWIGLGTIITLAIAAIVLRVVRRNFIGGIPDELRRNAADSIWSAVFHGLRVQVVVAAIAALIVALAGWLLGGFAAAVGVRDGVRHQLAQWRGQPEAGTEVGGFTRFVRRFRRPLQLLAVAVGLLVLLAGAKATLGLVLLATLIVVAVLLLVEFIAGPPAAGEA